MVDYHLKREQQICILTNNLGKLMIKFYIIKKILCYVRGWSYKNALKPLTSIKNYNLRIILRQNLLFLCFQKVDLIMKALLLQYKIFVCLECAYLCISRFNIHRRHWMSVKQ